MSFVTCADCGKTLRDGRRYDLGPLAEFMRCSEHSAAVWAGLSGDTQQRARCHGITRQVVERVAADLKEHPATIWPEVVDHDIEDTHRECASSMCSAQFAPKRRDHKFCSRLCAQREAKRKYRRKKYATDAKFRQEALAANARYREENRDYLKKMRKRYRAQRLAENPNHDKEHYQRYRETNLAYLRRKKEAAA